MKTQNLFKALVVSSVLIATTGMAAEEEVTLARLTGQTQCAPPAANYVTLGGATFEAEGKGLKVEAVRVAKLPNKMFCSACQCPDGTYYVVKAQRDDHAVQDLLADPSWEEVKTSTDMAISATSNPEVNSDL